MVSGISIVFLYVRDLDRSIEFYRDVLGISLERDPDDPAWADRAFPDGPRFGLHAWHEGVAEPSSGTIAVAFEVADIDEAATQLREAGVEVGTIAREDWGADCEFVDPDGYRLRLFQPPV